MKVVGIDQSYTGFGYSHKGVAKKKAFPKTKYSDPYLRLLAVEDWLTQWLCSLDDVDLVVMEGYASAAKFGREMAGELGWAVKRTIYLVTDSPPLIVPPTSLKKFVTGKGSGPKSAMLMHVFKQWGEEFSDDNQADAYSLEKFGEAYLCHTTATSQIVSLYQYQIEALEAVRKKSQEAE